MPVFPNAKGYGADWTFNSDYEVRIVTSLAADGAGSLKHAVETASTKPSVLVVFNGLSGTITLNEEIYLQSGHQTYIAGQTSTNGILIRMASNVEDAIFKHSGSPNGVIVRHIICALGATQVTPETTPHGGTEGSQGSGDGSGNVNGDNVTFTAGQNIIFDHCTFLWSTDESLNIFYTDGVTIQNCIIGEPLMYATHAYTTDSSSSGYYRPHAMGMITEVTNMTIYNNLFVHCNQRSPLAGADTVGTKNMEFVNNYIYNWGNYASNWNEDGAGALVRTNILNNVYQTGSDSSSTRRPNHLNPTSNNMEIYVGGVYSDNKGNDWDTFTLRGSQNPDSSDYNVDIPVGIRESNPHSFPLSSESIKTSNQIITDVLDNVGTKFNLAHEQRLKDDALNHTGSLINDPSDVGGYPTIASGTIITDSNSDGIPDSESSTWNGDTFAYVNYLADDLDESPTIPDLQKRIAAGNVLFIQ